MPTPAGPRREEAGERAAAAPEAVADEEIVRRVLAGDAAAFELLMRRHNRRLFRVARGIVGGAAEAEDVMQEAYLRAYEHLGRFEGRSKFATWLTRIAVHEAMARRRGRRRLRLVAPDGPEADAMTSPAAGRDAAEEASLEELRHVLAEAVDALPPGLRLVFTLRMVEGLGTEETAECLGLTPANVKVRLHRARRALQTWIDGRIGAEARRLYEFAGAGCDRVVREVLARLARGRGP